MTENIASHSVGGSRSFAGGVGGTPTAQRGAMRYLSLSVFALVFAGCSSGGIVTFAPDGDVDGATDSAISVVDSGPRPDTSAPRPDTNISPPDDAIIVEDTPSGVCNSLVNSATMIASRNVMGSAPPVIGGTITPGTYRLTDFTFYNNGGTDLPPVTIKLTLQFGAGVVQSISETPMETNRGTSTYSTSGSSMTMTQTCPAPPESTTLRYGVSGSNLYMNFDFMESGFNGTIRYTFTRF